MEKINSLLESETLPKNPQPLQLGNFELCSEKARVAWTKKAPNEKANQLLGIIREQLLHMKTYVKSIENDKNKFYQEGEIQNAIKMAMALIGKALTQISREYLIDCPQLHKKIFCDMVKHGNKVSLAIGDRDEYYDYDKISPDTMFSIVCKIDNILGMLKSVTFT